jgi:hypothetical protein
MCAAGACASVRLQAVFYACQWQGEVTACVGLAASQLQAAQRMRTSPLPRQQPLKAGASTQVM